MHALFTSYEGRLQKTHFVFICFYSRAAAVVAAAVDDDDQDDGCDVNVYSRLSATLRCRGCFRNSTSSQQR